MDTNTELELETPKITEIDLSSAEKFYETYQQYYLDTVKFKPKKKKLQYYLMCFEYGEIFFTEGYSIEEIYFIMLFKIKYNCWDDIYGCEYPLKKLQNPIKLFKSQYVNNQHYNFGKIEFTKK
jgi:hypothetical protein